MWVSSRYIAIQVNGPVQKRDDVHGIEYLFPREDGPPLAPEVTEGDTANKRKPP